ncbi:MAG: tail protein X [Proteobacteria bacterium]|nr:tail protein X [Pseudomonadota bacterium]
MGRTPDPLPVTWRGDGSAEYRAVGGEIIDHLCWRHYGREFDTLDPVVALNRGVGRGAVLEAGQLLVLPYLPAPAAPLLRKIRLFD